MFIMVFYDFPLAFVRKYFPIFSKIFFEDFKIKPYFDENFIIINFAYFFNF